MPTTKRELRRTALLLALALTCIVGVAGIAGPAQANPPAAAASPPVDISSTLPQAGRGEVTYDFLGRGYEQRLIAEGGNLNLYDAPARGGERLTSVALDLGAPPLSVMSEENTSFRLYDSYSNSDDISCLGCLEQRAVEHGYNNVYLAVFNDYLYISGTKNDSLYLPGSPDYANLIYRAPVDLSCAEQWCLGADNVLTLLNNFGDRIVATTSLAVGSSGGNTYLAVGLTDMGVYIFDSDLNQVSTFTGMATPETAQTPVISLAWDPAGSGKLAVGVMSYYNQGFVVDIDAAGAVGDYSVWYFLGYDQLYSSPMSVAFGRRADGSLIVVFGTTGGVSGGFPAGLFIVDPNTNGSALASIAVPGNGVVSIQAVSRLDGSTGGDDFAVFSESGSGSLIRYNPGTSVELSFQPLQPEADGTPTELAIDAWRSWWPGYKTGRFTVRNTLAEPVTVNLQTRPQAGYGCWFAPAFADAPAFPTAPVTVAPGQSSPIFTMGAYTAGAGGSCGADDVTGSWRGYLTITPQSRPADMRLVNLRLGRDLTLQVSDQTGGSTAVTAAKTGNPAAIGLWTLTAAGPAAPTPLAAPTIQSARQITTTVRGRSSVYRIDLNGTRWSIPGATATPAQVQAVLPPLQVQASLDGQNWVRVGSLIPVGVLNRSGTTVTTSGATFWWENPAGAPAYRQLRVLAGTLPSAAVVLSSLAPPAAPAVGISGLQLTATKTNSNVASVVPSGVDQAQVLVQITNANGDLLPANAAAYDSVYYRDPDNNLITNLYGSAFDEFVGVQPGAGAYPNVGATPRRGTRPIAGGLAYDYLTTTSESRTTATGWVGVGAPTAANSARLVANDQAVNIEAGGGTGAGGFSLEGCTDFTSGSSCVIAPVTATRPALYQAGSDADGPRLGVQLRIQGQNAVSALPLQWPANQPAQNLAASGLTLSNQSALATLTNADGLPSNSAVDTTLISHGQSVPVTVPVS